MSIAKALLALAPGAQWSIKDDKIHWTDTEQTEPTREEIVQKIAEIEYTEEVEAYKEVRAKAYPVMSEQLDKIFHEGIDAWKTEIQAIKDAHPKAVIDNDTLNSRKSQALFDLQLKEYTKAQERLSHYQVSVGREEVTEVFVIDQVYNEDTEEVDDVTETRVTVSKIEPLDPTIDVVVYGEEQYSQPESQTIENSLITQDNAERADAQAIVDATPSEVIDAYNAL